MSETMKAVAYYRISTNKQDESIPRQVRRYADQKGYVIVREYVDEGISGDREDGKRHGPRP